MQFSDDVSGAETHTCPVSGFAPLVPHQRNLSKTVANYLGQAFLLMSLIAR